MTADEVRKMIEDDPHSLARRRAERGVSQQGLADKLGIALSTVFHWEQGLRVPTGLYAQALAEWWE